MFKQFGKSETNSKFGILTLRCGSCFISNSLFTTLSVVGSCVQSRQSPATASLGTPLSRLSNLLRSPASPASPSYSHPYQSPTVNSPAPDHPEQETWRSRTFLQVEYFSRIDRRYLWQTLDQSKAFFLAAYLVSCCVLVLFIVDTPCKSNS